MYKVVKSLRGHQIGDILEGEGLDLKFLLQERVIVEMKDNKKKIKQSKEEE